MVTKGGEKTALLHAPHKMFLLPASPILNKLCKPKHKESNACVSITKPLTTIIGLTQTWLLTQLNFTSITMSMDKETTDQQIRGAAA